MDPPRPLEVVPTNRLSSPGSVRKTKYNKIIAQDVREALLEAKVPEINYELVEGWLRLPSTTLIVNDKYSKEYLVNYYDK